MPAYREDLDEKRCQCGRPACEDRMIFTTACCKDDRPKISYFDGVLTVECGECGALAAEIVVARKP